MAKKLQTKKRKPGRPKLPPDLHGVQRTFYASPEVWVKFDEICKRAGLSDLPSKVLNGMIHFIGNLSDIGYLKDRIQ